MAEPDLSRAPNGVLVAQQLIVAVAAHGDLAERHYLELKSTLDLSTKKDKEKIAKFILGASNRMPDVAATAFEGYGVMIIGVARDSITGIPPVEMLEISKVIQQYVGAAGPRWDIVWVPVSDSTDQVLVVLVEPPKVGQGPFPCRANGESLTDGRIYVRADGETREAKSEEVDLLVARGVAGLAVEVDFGVEVLGEVAVFSVDDVTTLEKHLSQTRQRLVAALPKKEPQTPTQSGASAGGFPRLVVPESVLTRASAFYDALVEPERRTEEEYRASIDRWEAGFRSAWHEAVGSIACSHIRPSIVKITNRTTTFFHGVEVRLHLSGDISAMDYRDPEYIRGPADLDLPHPPREWGPTQRAFAFSNLANAGSFYTPGVTQQLPPSVSFVNGGSVTLTLEVGELRPRGAYESEDEEIVLVVAGPAVATIHGTWELTARDHNDVYTGEIAVEVAPSRDLTEVMRAILAIEDRS